MYIPKKIILVLSVIFYSMDQVSSIMCYACYSVVDDGDQDCFDNPKKVAADCPEYITPGSPSAISEVAAYFAAKNTQERSLKVKVDECWKIIGTGIPSSKDAVHRACGSKEIGDFAIKTILLDGVSAGSILIKMNATSIHRCDSDLCNSSDILTAGSLYSILPLFFVYSINF